MTTQLSGWFTARQNPSLISGGMTASVRLLKCRWGKCCSDGATALGFRDSAIWLTPCRSAQASVSRLPATVPKKATSCLMAARSAAAPPPPENPTRMTCSAPQAALAKVIPHQSCSSLLAQAALMSSSALSTAVCRRPECIGMVAPDKARGPAPDQP